MKPFYPGLLLFIFLCTSATGYSQRTGSLEKPDKSLSTCNNTWFADYSGRSGRNGGSGFNIGGGLFHIVKNAKKGRPGHVGPVLHVKVAVIPSGDSAILGVSVTNDGTKKADLYYVNPRYGKLTIFAGGGSGGDGGDGADGPQATDKHPEGGSGSDGGNGGAGGNGGIIFVRFDSSALPYINCPCIRYLNLGGRGGRGGKGGSGTGPDSGQGNYGMDGSEGITGAPVYIEGPNGKTVKMVTDHF